MAREKPSACGKKWTEVEEEQLRNELEIDMNISQIAQNHNRTTGGIKSRIRSMAYAMYLNKKPIEEIMKTLRITENHLREIIQWRSPEKSEPEPVPAQTEFDIVKTELAELKTEVQTLKKMLKHICTLMESVYEFESA